MKFKDPLAVLPYLGGYFPNHVILMSYSAFIYFFIKSKAHEVHCDGLKNQDIDEEFTEVFWMMLSHMMYLVSLIVTSFLSKHKTSSMFKREFVIYCDMLFYIMCYLAIQSHYFQGPTKVVEDCIKKHESLKDIFYYKQQYLIFEIMSFYALAATLFVYLVFARVMVIVKQWRNCDVYDDPFTQLVMG